MTFLQRKYPLLPTTPIEREAGSKKSSLKLPAFTHPRMAEVNVAFDYQAEVASCNDVVINTYWPNTSPAAKPKLNSLLPEK
jgi:hypothetical protein